MIWEAVARNKRRSAFLLILLAGVMVVFFGSLGYLLGDGKDPDYMWVGCGVGAVVWVVMLLVNLAAGERLLMASAGAREVRHEDAPQIYNLVEEMRIAAALPAMPKVYVMDSAVPNAFAVGLKPERASVAVTTGLVQRLNRDELQGVIAHEIAHISNRDTLFMTLAGISLGAIVLAADVAWRMILYGGRSRRKMDGRAQLIVFAIAIAFAILAPLIARILYFACSRQREYLADASAAQFTRYPDALANALEKISTNQNAKKLESNRVVAPMYIINPLAASGSSSIFGTHPPTAKRIQALREMRGSFTPKK